MFTKAELLERLPGIADLPVRNMEVIKFGHEDFTSRGSEQIIDVHRGRKTDFGGALQFWLGSLQSQDWNGGDYLLNYAKNSPLLPLTKQRFMELIADYSSSLRRPLNLTPQGEFQSASQMHNDWNDVALLAEFGEEYIAFYWATTA